MLRPLDDKTFGMFSWTSYRVSSEKISSRASFDWVVQSFWFSENGSPSPQKSRAVKSGVLIAG
jgi:hypothetical protein